MGVGMGTTAMNDEEDELHRHLNHQHHQHQEDDVKAAHHHHGNRGGRWPPWLRPMLSARFFVQCTKPHEPATTNPSGAPPTTTTSSGKATECNMYCLDCSSSAGALCPLCVPAHRRAGHRTVQIRRSSYHDVVRVGEIQRVLDVSGVQTYVINSARVVFLNERPQTKGKAGGGGGGGGERGGGGGSGGANACEVCRRMLLDSFRFCSLGCKVAGTSKSNKHQTAKKLLSADTDSEGSCTTTDDRRARSSGSNSDGGRFGAPARFSARAPPAAATYPGGSPAKRRRKGIPHRAPFGTTLPFDDCRYCRY